MAENIARNPTTGETVWWDGSAWVPVKATGAAPEAAAPETPQSSTMGYPNLGDYGQLGRSAARTVIGGAGLIPKGLKAIGVPGMDESIAINDAAHEDLGPRTQGERLLHGAEQVGEQFMPVFALGKKLNLATAAMRPTTRTLARGAAQGALSGALTGAQTNDTSAAVKGAGVAGAAEMVTSGFPAILRAGAVNNWVKILRKGGLNPAESRAVERALGEAGSELPVGGRKSLARATEGKVDRAGEDLKKVFGPIENDPISIQGASDSIEDLVNKPVARGGKTISREVRFNNLPFNDQIALIDSNLPPGSPTFNQMPPQVQQQMFQELTQANQVIKRQMYKDERLVGVLGKATRKIDDLESRNPTVGQARGLRQDFGNQVFKKGEITPRVEVTNEAMNIARDAVSQEIHLAFPETKQADAAFNLWQTINTKVQDAATHNEGIGKLWQYYGAKMVISGAIGGTAAYSQGQSAAGIGLTALSFAAMSQTPFWNSLSAKTKNQLAHFAEVGNVSGATALLNSSAIVYISGKQAANRRAEEQERINTRQRTGTMRE